MAGTGIKFRHVFNLDDGRPFPIEVDAIIGDSDGDHTIIGKDQGGNDIEMIVDPKIVGELYEKRREAVIKKMREREGS